MIYLILPADERAANARVLSCQIKKKH